MNEHKTVIRVAAVIVVSILVLIALSAFSTANAFGSNRSWFDTTYAFDWAQISMPDGSVVSGEVQSWQEYENSDAIQVKINGEVYYTHLSNVVLKAR